MIYAVCSEMPVNKDHISHFGSWGNLMYNLRGLSNREKKKHWYNKKKQSPNM